MTRTIPSITLSLSVLLLAFAPSHSTAQEAEPARPASGSQEAIPAKQAGSGLPFLCYEPTGISLLQPYARGKVPVLLIHGLWSSPWSWHKMIKELEGMAEIRERYQFWTFGYSTGDPIPYSAHLLRLNLDEARRRLDPDHSDTAFDKMVVVGHSMGGLVTKMIAIDPEDRLWRVVSDRPFVEMQGEREDIELFRDGLLFAPRREVRRTIFIATPHRGSHFDKGSIQRIGTRLVRLPDPLRAAHRRLVERNAGTFFRDVVRKGIPSSIDELEWGSPMLTGLHDIPLGPTIATHSIIAVRPSSPPGDRNDGLVSFESAHLAGVVSEKVVPTGHLCQDHPDVIEEVKRILKEHVAHP